MDYLIDTHCHLTDKSDDEIKDIVKRAHELNVKKMICIGASDGITSSFKAVEISKKFNEIYATVGIHPHDVDDNNWTAELIAATQEPKVLAIGETGLDFFKDWSDFEKQRSLFRESINIAKSVKKPLVIHCRDAFDECLSILKEEDAQTVGGVFHCYSGTSEQANKLKDINFLVSYTGILTFKNAHKIREEAKEIPLSQIMTETDCPYMAPEPFRGKESEPSHVHYIANKLSEIYGISLEEVTSITTQNACKLFHGLS